MLKIKCIISFETNSIASPADKKSYREIAKNIVNSVLNDDCAVEIVEGCENSFAKGIEVNLLFTDDESIRLINNQHRNINKSTDVLSFPINDFAYGKGNILPFNIDEDTNNFLLGDIVISIPTMCRQATEYGHGSSRECAFLICHGMLHLLGYDHMNTEDEKQMFGLTESILEKAGYTR